MAQIVILTFICYLFHNVKLQNNCFCSAKVCLWINFIVSWCNSWTSNRGGNLCCLHLFHYPPSIRYLWTIRTDISIWSTSLEWVMWITVCKGESWTSVWCRVITGGVRQGMFSRRERGSRHSSHSDGRIHRTFNSLNKDILEIFITFPLEIKNGLKIEIIRSA